MKQNKRHAHTLYFHLPLREAEEVQAALTAWRRVLVARGHVTTQPALADAKARHRALT
jgi:hypothetical protein